MFLIDMSLVPCIYVKLRVRFVSHMAYKIIMFCWMCTNVPELYVLLDVHIPS